MMPQKIENAVALVTGANRGIGREFVTELLRRGAKKIYLGARDPASLTDLVAVDPARLVPLKLDVTNAADVAEAAKIATDVTLLINNAGFAGGQGVISAPDISIARQEMEGVIFKTVFTLQKGDPTEITEKMQAMMQRRRASQPLDMPSAGSTFKRPVGAYAAALIEQCGLKGKGVGAAAVSEKHAGFVVNLGGATAADVLATIRLVQREVQAQTGFSLEPEVKLF